MGSKAFEHSTEQVCKLIQDSGFDYSVVEVFRENKIDGIEFVSLSRDDMKELGISALGDRKKLLRLIHTLESNTSEAGESLRAISSPVTSGSLLSYCSNERFQDVDSLSSCDYSNSSINEEAQNELEDVSMGSVGPPGKAIVTNIPSYIPVRAFYHR